LASAKEIPPGGEGKIAVTFKTKGRQGRQSKRITVRTNDPDEPTVYLTVTAEVLVPFALRPSRIHFGRVTEDGLISKSISAYGEQLAHAAIKSVSIVNKAHESYYDVKVEDSGKNENRTVQLLVSPTKEIPIGRFFDQLKVTTDLPDAQSVVVSLSGERVGPVEPSPRSLILRRTSQGTIRGSILLGSMDQGTFKVLRATCPDPRATIAFHPLEEAGTVRLEARLPDEFDDPAFRSEVVVTINKGDTFDLTVPMIYLGSPSPQPPPFLPKNLSSTQRTE